MTHRLHTTTWIPRSRLEVFAFFSDAENPAAVTLPESAVEAVIPTPTDDGVRRALPLPRVGEVAYPLVRARLARTVGFRQRRTVERLS